MGTASKTKPQGNKGKKKKEFNYRKLIIGSIIAAILAVIGAMGIYILIIINGANILKENIDKFDTKESTLIFDVNGTEAAKLYKDENRESVDSKEIPDLLKKAFIATEDRRFESHAGIDFWAIGRALVKDITHGSMVEGGSTITQQLAKNVFLNSQKTFLRKATEVSIAIAIDNNYTKDEIMEKYLNRIFFGSRAYGIKAAAKVYFGKSDLNQLELWEMATLAALPKAPSTYSPISNPEKSKERREVVLRLMTDQGYITEEQRAAAAAVDYTPPKNTNAGSKDYATFVDYVVNEAEEIYGIDEDELLTKGYRIYTTMDAKAQKIMEQTYADPKFFQKDASDGEKIQSSMVIINHKDGSLVAMIGGRDYQPKGLNRVFSQRQPGSSFKPIIAYAPAIESGDWNPYSKIDDSQRTFGTGNGYTPRNYDGTYRGMVTMMDAVKHSYNVAAVWMLNEIGVDKGIAFAKKLGIALDPKDRNLAIALGGLTVGVSPMEMATAYGTFANGGVQNRTHAILKIMNDEGHEVAAYKPEKKKIMDPKTAYYMTLLMQGVTEQGGTGVRAKFDRPVAGKTGSTGLSIKGIEKYDRDVWFVGYTPEWTAAVWQGFDKTDAKHFVTIGSGSTAAIFKEVMSKALAGKPKSNFVKPEGIPDPQEPPKGIGELAAAYVQETKSVKLSWSSQGENVAYQIFRKDAKQADFQMLIQAPTAEITDTTVIPGETYRYYVVPMNTQTSVSGEKSNEVEVAVPEDGNPQAAPSPLPLPGKEGHAGPSSSPSAQPGSIKPGASPGQGSGNAGGGSPPGGNGAGPSPSAKPSPSPSPSANSAAGGGDANGGAVTDGVKSLP